MQTFPWLCFLLLHYIIILGEHISHKHIGTEQQWVWQHNFHPQCQTFFRHISAVLLHDIIVPGEHISHNTLGYTPCWFSAITTLNNKHVMVAQRKPPAIRIHELPSGKTVRGINYQELKLSEKGTLHGIHFSDQLLHVAEGAAGESKKTESLHIYKVQYSL